jgi:DNA-binding transcriptional ArsR family regulator
MLESIVTSKTRIQILLRFFLNPKRSAYLRELATELGESSNAVRIELNRMEDAKLIESSPQGRMRLYQANTEHPLFSDIHNIVKKTLGIDKVINNVVQRLGYLRIAYITGDYARGIDSGIIDLILVGKIDRDYLDRLVQKTEPMIGNRKIRCLCLSEDDFKRLSPTLFCDKAIFEIYKRPEE